MDLFVAEVTQSTNRRADARIDVARGIANDLGKLSTAAAELMRECPDPSQLSGPVAAKHLRPQRRLVTATGKFKERLASFANEHGALLGARVLKTLNEFVDWCPRYQDALEARVVEFKRDFARDMATDRERLRALSSDWDVTANDGIPG
jgi:hypothetical protein